MAATSARMKALNADPEFAARRDAFASARMKALNADPEFKAATSERMKRLNADKLAWCPPELIEDYRLLARHLGATEAREAIEHQVRHEQVIPVCWHCDKRIDHPDCRACTMLGCPLARDEAA